MTRFRIVAPAIVATGLLASPALAQRGGGEAGAGASIAGQLGFLVGDNGFNGEFATGFRAGYTFPFHLYLGGDLTFYLGGRGTTAISLSPEIGYDIGVTRSFVIRPYGGLGFVDFPETNFNNNDVALEFYPGCEFLGFVTRGFFLGGDVRIPFFFIQGNDTIGLNLMFTIGYKW